MGRNAQPCMKWDSHCCMGGPPNADLLMNHGLGLRGAKSPRMRLIASAVSWSCRPCIVLPPTGTKRCWQSQMILASATHSFQKRSLELGYNATASWLRRMETILPVWWLYHKSWGRRPPAVVFLVPLTTAALAL